MRRRRIKPLLTRPKSSHPCPTRRQSAPAKLPIQSTPAPRPHLRVRAPQRHPHTAEHEPEPIDTPVFSTPRPTRKRRVSENPIRPRRVSETPIRPRRVSETPLSSAAPTPAVTPAAHQVADVVPSQPSGKRARVRCSPGSNGSQSVRARVVHASVSPMRNSALLASPGLLSAHIPLTIESVFSSDEAASCAPATFCTQRRISFGVPAGRPSQHKDTQPRSHSQSPQMRVSSNSARNSDLPEEALLESEQHIAPELTQRHLSPGAPQLQPSDEPSPQKLASESIQVQPSPGLSRQPSDVCSPLFPASQRSPITPNHAPSQLSPPASQPPSSSQGLKVSLPSSAPTNSPSTARIQDTKRFRRVTMSLSTGNDVCSWGGELDSPSMTALNIFRKPAQQSNHAPVQLRGRSPIRCTPCAPSPSASHSSPVQQPKRTPAQLRRDPVASDDLEQLIPETPTQTGDEARGRIEQAGGDSLRTEDKAKEDAAATERTQRVMPVGSWRSEYKNEVDDCSSTQSPCGADLIDNITQEAREENTKAQGAAIYCRSVLVSIPSGALRSLDKRDSPQ